MRLHESRYTCGRFIRRAVYFLVYGPKEQTGIVSQAEKKQESIVQMDNAFLLQI